MYNLYKKSFLLLLVTFIAIQAKTQSCVDPNKYDLFFDNGTLVLEEENVLLLGDTAYFCVDINSSSTFASDLMQNPPTIIVSVNGATKLLPFTVFGVKNEGWIVSSDDQTMFFKSINPYAVEKHSTICIALVRINIYQPIVVVWNLQSRDACNYTLENDHLVFSEMISFCSINNPNQDCDGDGNNNETDLNPESPIANPDEAIGKIGDTVIVNILENDDFVVNDSYINFISNTGSNQPSFDNASGSLTYIVSENDVNNDIMIRYLVCHDTVCAPSSLLITLETIVNCPIHTKVFLEGALIFPGFRMYNNEMRKIINSVGLLPGQTPISSLAITTKIGHPYSGGIWNYNGNEGQSINDYHSDVIDWVLIDIRKEMDSNSNLCRQAGLLLKNGEIIFPSNQCDCQINNGDLLRIAVHHRNHLPIISQEVEVTLSQISFDFTTNQSYYKDLNKGQKIITLDNTKFVMYAGNAEAGTYNSSDYNDINASDFSKWIEQNSFNDVYTNSDLDLNADVNSNDKFILIINAGISSQIIN